MKRLLPFYFVFCGLSLAFPLQFVLGQGLPVVPPETIGLSPERLARIDRQLEEEIRQGRLPGAVALIARHGRIGYFKSFGIADRESGKSMESETLFRIASMTKPIVSTAVLMLYEEGRFLLNDPVSRYIPEFKNPKVLDEINLSDTSYTSHPAGREVTIHDLLTHTSGISYGLFDERMRPVYRKAGVPDAWDQRPITVGEKMRILAGLPLSHEPGERFTYGMNIDMLGYLVEVVSGEPLDVYLKKHLFEPLGMNDTHFYLPDEKAGQLAAVYYQDDQGALRRFGQEADYPVRGARSYFSGGGGLVSTASDYARFLQMFLNEGELEGRRILSPKTVRLMTVDHLREAHRSPGFNFGLGFFVVEDLGSGGELSTVGSYGWSGYWGTLFWVDPAEDMFGIFMSQMSPSLYDHTRFQVGAYQALIESQETPRSTSSR